MSASYLWALLVKDPLILGSTAVCGSVSVGASYLDRSGKWPDRIARFWAKLLLLLAGARVRVHGIENIDLTRGSVFVGNHLSLYDTPVVLANLPVRFRFLVHAKYVRKPFLGDHLQRTGHFGVEPTDVRASLRVMTSAAKAVRESGLSVLVFPEGSRATGEMGEFKGGAAYIAIKAGAPVVPFAIAGTREILPINSLHVRGGPVELVFGKPIPTSGYTLQDRDRLNEQMHDAVAALHDRQRVSHS